MTHRKIFYKMLPVLRHSGALRLYRQISRSPRRIVFLYHRVGPQVADWMLPSIPLAKFESQMAFLSKHFTLVSLDELAIMLQEGSNLPQRLAAVTFDDGYRNTYTHAFPILEKYKIPATVFLTSGIIDDMEAFWWDRVCYSLMNSDINKVPLNDNVYRLSSKPRSRLKDVRNIIEDIKCLEFSDVLETARSIEDLSGEAMPQELRKTMTMNWDEVQELHSKGMGIGSHTLNHPCLLRISHDEAEKEIIGSKKLIEKRTGIEVNHFSYPHGHHADMDRSTIELVRKGGFKSAYTIIPTPIDEKTDPFFIGRVLPEYHPDIFVAYTSGLVQKIYWRT